jgi:hypothetical protein
LIMGLSFLSFASLATAAPLSGYIEGWEVSGDLAGWEPNTNAANVAVVDVGGNPGGYLSSVGDPSLAFDIGAGTSISQVTGNYSGTPWRVEFDLLLNSGTFDNAWYRIRDAANGWLFPLGAELGSQQWQSFSITFDPSWTDGEAAAAGWLSFPNPDFPSALPSNSWAQTLSDVTFVEIRVSAEGPAEVGIDNYRLTAVPIPASAYLFASGLFGLVGMVRRKAA